MARLILVRHAESIANRDRRALGQADPPLTDLGQRQARAVAAALRDQPLDHAFASPLQRARETAEAIVAGRAIPLDLAAALVEMDIGAMEGLDFRDAAQRYAEFFSRWQSDHAPDVPMPGGESLRQVQERAWAVVGPWFQPERPETTLVVTHNFVIRTLLCRALDLDLPLFRRFQLELASITVVDGGARHGTLRVLNDVHHLTPDLRPAPPAPGTRAPEGPSPFTSPPGAAAPEPR